MVHFGGIQESVLAGSFTSGFGTQGEQNSLPFGGDLSTILGPRRPLSHFILSVSNLEGSEVWN